MKSNNETSTGSKSGFNLTGSAVNPRKPSERTLGPSGLVAIWFSMAVCISLFVQSAQLYESLKVYQIIIALFVAHTLLCVLMSFTQDLGIRYGIPFAVALRTSFGYAGYIIPAFCRAIPGMFWFGFQTWLGADALNAITQNVWGYSNLTLYLIILAILQIAHTCLGIKAVTRLSKFASPLLLFVGIYLLYMMFSGSDLTFTSVLIMKGTGGGTFTLIGAILMYIGGWATLAVSISDITRECKVDDANADSWWKSTKKYIFAQWLGLVPATVIFGTIGAVGVALTGEWNPIRIMINVIGPNNYVMLIICLVFVLLATWSTNDTGNLYPSAYTVAAAWPAKITFAKGVIIAGTIGMLMQPWRVADNLTNLTVAIGCMLAPVVGVMLTDYYILRKRKINMDDLYNSNGQYKYWKNVNPAAIIACVVGVLVSIPFWNFVFFVGLVVAGVVYYILMKVWILKKYPQLEIPMKD